MDIGQQRFEVRLAADETEVAAAQRLRYAVFVEEMGAMAPGADHAERLERDAFDTHVDHMILIDRARRPPDPLDAVVGVYRLMPGDRAAAGPGFYGAAEYDLSPLVSSGRRLLELGRSCLHRNYRGGAAMHHLWNGLAIYALERHIEILFGVASFPGQEPDAFAQSLAYLHHRHLAPEDLRVRATGGGAAAMNRMPPDRIDRTAALLAIPPLIKAYLRLGGFVGDGAYVDRDFNTVDVCLLMDTARMTARTKDHYVALHTGRTR